MTTHPGSTFLSHSNRSHGFTLVEAVVIIGILALLAAFSAPALSSWMDRADLKRATRNLVSTLQFARVQAVKENRTINVQITQTGWSVVRKTDDAKLRSFSLNTLRSKVRSDGNATIGFKGNGRLVTATNKSIELTSSGGKTLTVTLSSAGRIKTE